MSLTLAQLPPILQRIYKTRGIKTITDLDRQLCALLSYDQLLNINKAAKRLVEALQSQQKMVIIGDFDADGATSSALLVAALKQFGATQVNYLVPNRFTYGYGLTPAIVEVAAQRQPDLVITVDNGIASHAGVDKANSLGMEVIITDHHLPGETLPNAYAIVNPNQRGDPFKSKSLAGVGVAFYLLLALRAQLKTINWFEQQAICYPNMADYLDLVALGTVADLVKLDKNNRILVYQGLMRMRTDKMRPGIRALLSVAGCEAHQIDTSTLGFRLAPRLNAAGRLDDMSLGIACLLAEDDADAMKYAQRLDQLNRERRVIEQQMQREAYGYVDQLQLANDLPKGVCLFDEKWHQGVIGLVASRVKDKIHRPVIAFAQVDDITVKGSARSIAGLHIRDVLAMIAVDYPDLLQKFGGHAMAAGLQIEKSSLSKFTQVFTDYVAATVTEQQLQISNDTDGELTSSDLTLMLAELIKQAGPWGQGFEEPMFEGEFHLIQQRIVGQRHLKMTIQIPQSNSLLEAIAFGVDLDHWPNYRCKTVQMTYRLDINEYNGRRRLQLLVQSMQPKIEENVDGSDKARLGWVY